MFYDITSTHSWHQISSIWHHNHSLGHHTTLCMTSIHCIWPHVHYICVITPTLSMISQSLYGWYHIQYICWHHIPYIYAIISRKYDMTTLCVNDTTIGICVTYFALQMTSHPLYHTKPQYLWCHIHFSHDIIPPVSDIAPAVSLSSQPLLWYRTHFWMTSHTHFCVTSYALYITSHQILMSSQYCT